MEALNVPQAPLATWVYLLPLFAIAFTLLMWKVTSRCANSRTCSTDNRTSVPAPHSSRFLPGVFAGVAGCMILVGATFLMNGRGRFMHRQVARAEPQMTIVENDAEQLLARVREKGDLVSEPIPVTVPRKTTENLPPAEPDLAPIDNEQGLSLDRPPTITIFEKGGDVGLEIDELPDWTSQTGDVEGFPRVVKSGPHATIRHAQTQAIHQLVPALHKAFTREHPQAARWSTPRGVIENSGLIGRRAIVERQVTVGEFSEPVFEAYLEITPPEDLDAQLFTAWREHELQSRLLLVGGGMGILTLMFGSLAGYFRLDEATRGKHRNKLRIGTAALWIVTGLILARIAAGLALTIVA